MKCTSCTFDRPLKAKKIKYDYSEKCGIPGCFITAKEYICPKCKDVIIDLGEHEEVNRAIGEELVQAVSLTRAMCRFVRIHFFDESPFEFAKRIGQNPTVYTEIESHKRPMTDLIGYLVQEQIMKRFLIKKMKPITISIGNKKTKLKSD